MNTEDKLIEACIRSALDIMRLTLVDIDINDNSDGTKDVDILVKKKEGRE